MDNGTVVGTVANLGGRRSLGQRLNVTFDQPTNGTLNNTVSGSGSFTAAGPGMLTIGTPMTYSGPTTISAGTLQLAVAVSAQPLVEYQLSGTPGGSIPSGTTIINTGSLGSALNGTMVGSGATSTLRQFRVRSARGSTRSTSGHRGLPINNLTSWTLSVWIDPDSSRNGYW